MKKLEQGSHYSNLLQEYSKKIGGDDHSLRFAPKKCLFKLEQIKNTMDFTPKIEETNWCR